MTLATISFPNRPHRVVRILTDDIGKVTAALPTAQPVQYYPTGQVHVDVAWTLHNMTILSQIFQPAISTIFDGYTFPGRNRPYYHQLRIAEFLTRNPRSYCFAGMGTGKTRSACWAADYLMTVGVVKRALVVCPKSLMYSAWVDDIAATCIHRTHTVLYGDRSKREHLIATRDTDFDIINFDGVEILRPQLERKQYDLIIVDESTAYKDADTKRWAALKALVTATTRVWALTGTPTPQGPMDAYGQGKLVTPHRMPRTKTAFRDMVQIKKNKVIWINRPNWQNTVRELLQPAIYIRKSDCLDLPPVVRSFVEVGLSKPQQQALELLRRTMLADFETGHQVVAANAAVLYGKLRQIYSGAVYADDGTAMVLDNKARIAETIEAIKRAKASGDDTVAGGKPHSKALVFVPFRHTMQVVVEALKKEFAVAVITGDTSVPERKRVLDEFQTQHTIDVIVAIPEAFSHGVTATAASLTVWYAPPNRTETYLQACERMDRPGQTQQMNIIHLYGDSRERRMYQALIDNQQNQDTLLQMYYDLIRK